MRYSSVRVFQRMFVLKDDHEKTCFLSSIQRKHPCYQNECQNLSLKGNWILKRFISLTSVNHQQIYRLYPDVPYMLL